jgi:hypothetical protein
MPKYLITGSYTPAGIKGVLGEGGSSRRVVVEKLAESVGGTDPSISASETTTSTSPSTFRATRPQPPLR